MFSTNFPYIPILNLSLTFIQSSSINPEHLSFFKFVGRIIGKALHDQRILEAYFSRC